MSTQLILGSVAFEGFEVPERVSIGGKQRLIVHTMPGGGRIVDAMGPDDAPIRWSGIFSGPNAAERVRTLERLRRGGLQQQLSWDAWLYSVIIEQFEAEVTNSCWIPYKIQLCVLGYAGSEVSDWLNIAATPSLTVAALTGSALDAQIQDAGAGLLSTDLGSVVFAAGRLAQYVTVRAYGARAS